MTIERAFVSYVVPAFNEASIIKPHLHELYDYISSLRAGPFEIIVVDDGSSDETGILADAFAAAHPGVEVEHHLENRGLTAALRTGFARARGDIVLALDLDLSYAPYHIALMLRALQQTNAAIVLASPYMRGGKVADVPWMRRELSVWANRYLAIAAGGSVATSTCMVRGYNTAAMRKLRCSGEDLDFNHRMLFAALRQGMSVVEVPARLQWRRSASGDRRRWRPSTATISHAWSVIATGLRYRPSMLLAIPGLLPGLLPAVAALLVLTHWPVRIAAEVTGGVIAVQILSMAFAAELAGGSFYRLRMPAPASPSQLPESRTEYSA